MAASGDVSLPDAVRLHPYIVAIVRWCVSSLWSTASVLLQRLLTGSLTLPAFVGKPSNPKQSPRPPSRDHLDPEPKVECVVLHQPCSEHQLDVIFVHGLYGSLGNTWRQGEWRSKYPLDPERIHLRRPTSMPVPCQCSICTQNNGKETVNDENINNNNNDTKNNFDNILDSNEFTNNDVINDINEYTKKSFELNDNVLDTKFTNEFENYDMDDDFRNIDDNFLNNIKILPHDDVFITSKFYNNTLINQVNVIDNYETQAQFVSDLFKCDNNCDDKYNKNNDLDTENYNYDIRNAFKSKNATYKPNNDTKMAGINEFRSQNGKTSHGTTVDDLKIASVYETEFINGKSSQRKTGDLKTARFFKKEFMNVKAEETDDDLKMAGATNEFRFKTCAESNDLNMAEGNRQNCKCKANDMKCDIGCGCVCDGCYSACWPKDWIKEDYPDARVISINYTSDPHLWRPLWIKESKRLHLHERAQQMCQQLLDLEVGKRPIVWVGHSKGGLFIKEIYCEAYEAHQKLNKRNSFESGEQIQECDQDNITNKDIEINNQNIIADKLLNDDTNEKTFHETTKENTVHEKTSDGITRNILACSKFHVNTNGQTLHETTETFHERSDCHRKTIQNTKTNHEDGSEHIKTNHAEDTFHEKIEQFVSENDIKELSQHCNFEIVDENCMNSERCENELSSSDEDPQSLSALASLYSNSAAFMFYSVPHRGSPLADIKTPVTARSVELQEIAKDCSLVLSLQERWLAATAATQPLVRSLVETRRTLMSVLWLKIVSTDSADPGIGALCGVSVDHREICKPTSRHCLLYTELARLIRVALDKHQHI